LFITIITRIVLVTFIAVKYCSSATVFQEKIYFTH
jgi:hypothetical protein